MVSKNRWTAAQEYEAGYWENAASRIEADEGPDLSWYEWRANQLQEKLERLNRLHVTQQGAVLEVGAGPVGVASYLPAPERIAVDPLQSFYATKNALIRPRSRGVLYLEGVGEELPLPDQTFDLVIIENCIDHVKSVNAVMKEIRRVLKDEGVLYLTVNCRTRPGYVVHRILSNLKIDRGHPHTFTMGKARRLVTDWGFEVLSLDRESYWSQTWADLTSGDARSAAKAMLGVSEYTVAVIAVKLPKG